MGCFLFGHADWKKIEQPFHGWEQLDDEMMRKEKISFNLCALFSFKLLFFLSKGFDIHKITTLKWKKFFNYKSQILMPKSYIFFATKNKE